MAEYGEHTFGEVARGTVEAVSQHVRPVAAYVVVLSVIGAAIELVDLGFLRSYADDDEVLSAALGLTGLGAGLAVIPIFVLGVIGQYLLWETMLRGHLSVSQPRRRYFAFLGQAILISLASGFGYLLLIVPGLIMSARWSIAPALIVKRDQRIVEAMGNSWHAVKGNTTPVVLAVVVVAVVMWFVAGVSLFGSAANDPLGVALAQLSTHAGSVLSIGLGAFLYRRLYDPGDELAEVFA